MLEPLFDAELDYHPGMPPLTSKGDGALVGSGDGAAQDRVLVPEHQELGVLGYPVPGQHRQAAEQTTDEQVNDRNDHSAMSPAGKSVQARSSKRAPQDPPLVTFKSSDWLTLPAIDCR